MVSRRVSLCAFLLLTAPALAASLDVEIGKRLFERNWVSAPSSTPADDGLGPLYDAPSCASCHAEKAATAIDETSTPPGLVLRLGTARGEPDPVYGFQLQTHAVAGAIPEANPDIQWLVKDGFRSPRITLYSMGYGALGPATKIGLRRPPSLKGLGLLAQIPESEILARADPDDANHDGIAGRASWLDVPGGRAVGRFGWRASQPSIAAQTALALSRDIGLSTAGLPDAWGDCTAAQRTCRGLPSGASVGETELAPAMFDLVVGYVASLPPPRAKDAAGARVFLATGCAACHATLKLANGREVRAYTDLLLHDLGAGLNDGIAEGSAAPGLWRTAPLWDVAGSLRLGGLLHDGRARNVGEAVEWHGGEAAGARTRFRALSPADKSALVALLAGT